MLPLQRIVQMFVLAAVRMEPTTLVTWSSPLQASVIKSREPVCLRLAKFHIRCQPQLHRVPELVQKGVMCQEVDVLDMVVCLLSALSLAPGLPRVDAFQDTEPPAAKVDNQCEEASVMTRMSVP